MCVKIMIFGRFPHIPSIWWPVEVKYIHVMMLFVIPNLLI